MRIEHLKDNEDKFHKELTDTSGKKWTASPGSLPNTTRLECSFKDYYYKEEVPKKQICTHMTVGELRSSVAELSKQHVSVAYIVAIDGTVYELFDPKYWSYHLGPSNNYNNKRRSSESAGIEIVNMGPLIMKDHILYDIYHQPYCRETDTDYYIKADYRGYHYFATLSDAQYESIDNLLLNLCKEFNISPSLPPEEARFDFTTEFPTTGIYHHAQVRLDKVDLHPGFIFNKITGI